MSRAFPILALGPVALLCGCSGPPTLVPVSGTVNVDGKPAAGVQVHFTPLVVDPESFATRRGLGITDAQGRFKVLCAGGQEGIETGKYKVTFFRPMVGGNAAPTTTTLKPEGAGITETMPEIYRKPETTPVETTVPKGGGELPPFEIKTK